MQISRNLREISDITELNSSSVIFKNPLSLSFLNMTSCKITQIGIISIIAGIIII